MSWKCPKCSFELGDEACQCVACGYRIKTRLVLTSNIGKNWITTVSTEVTRRSYRHIYPDVEHQYIPRNDGENPYSVILDANNCWFLKANGNSPVAVMLNGSLCESGSEYQLNNGDSIAIASRNDSSKQVAPVKVSFVKNDAG